MKIYGLKLYAWCVLLSAHKPNFWEKLAYYGKLLATVGPIVAMTQAFETWFVSNQIFIGLVLVALIINMIIGGAYHYKLHTFNHWEMARSNIKMMAGVYALYILLEMLRSVAEDNIVSETFKALVQLTTLLWPVSKSLKNLYIIYDKKFPPAFIMERLYNFEKTGNIQDLYGNDSHENTPGQ